MSEKMREEFEVEYLASMNSRYFSDESEKLVYLKRDDNGDYVHDLTYNAFNWWCKSRAALVVELPQKPYCAQGMAYPDYSDALNDCREAIESVGVKCK